MDIQQTRESVLNRQIDVPQINVEEVEQIYENDENEEEDINIPQVQTLSRKETKRLRKLNDQSMVSYNN